MQRISTKLFLRGVAGIYRKAEVIFLRCFSLTKIPVEQGVSCGPYYFFHKKSQVRKVLYICVKRAAFKSCCFHSSPDPRSGVQGYSNDTSMKYKT